MPLKRPQPDVMARLNGCLAGAVHEDRLGRDDNVDANTCKHSLGEPTRTAADVGGAAAAVTQPQAGARGGDGAFPAETRRGGCDLRDGPRGSFHSRLAPGLRPQHSVVDFAASAAAAARRRLLRSRFQVCTRTIGGLPTLYLACLVTRARLPPSHALRLLLRARMAYAVGGSPPAFGGAVAFHATCGSPHAAPRLPSLRRAGASATAPPLCVRPQGCR